jgi:phosphoglycolate phosphatase-like HAD superfamily hydrolase
MLAGGWYWWCIAVQIVPESAEGARGTMHLVVFDIDGTLTASSRIDAECFLQAIAEELGIRGVQTDWSSYGHVTDPGILVAIVQHDRGRMPTTAEVRAVKARHLHLLRQKIGSDPNACQPIPGASDVVRDLRSMPDVVVSFASGAWQQSALTKLESARIPYHGIPMATGDDAVSRTAIMMMAEERTRRRTGCKVFYSRTYVGDAPWDVQAARELGYEFVGIARGLHADRLWNAGARCVVADFRDGAFRRRLEQVWGDRRPRFRPGVA